MQFIFPAHLHSANTANYSLTYTKDTFQREREKKKEGGKKGRIVRNSTFARDPLIGKKPLTVEICIFHGYTPVLLEIEQK